ncbi:hypothetical protein H311_01465 [Anncaliia algerae PRA109]|nr:hypothetical protein H311_01465 [Anncaliia algerae PRA109]
MVESQESKRKESNTYTTSLNKYFSVNISSSNIIKSAYVWHLLDRSYPYGPDKKNALITLILLTTIKIQFYKYVQLEIYTSFFDFFCFNMFSNILKKCLSFKFMFK